MVVESPNQLNLRSEIELKYLVDYPNSYTVYIHHARGVLRIVLTIDEWHVWAYKSYDVTTPLTTQTVSPRGSRSPCPDQKGIRGFWGNIISVLSVALSLRLGSP